MSDDTRSQPSTTKRLDASDFQFLDYLIKKAFEACMRDNDRRRDKANLALDVDTL